MLIDILFRQNKHSDSFQTDIMVKIHKIIDNLIKSGIITNFHDDKNKTMVPYYGDSYHIQMNIDHEFHDASDVNDHHSPIRLFGLDRSSEYVAYPVSFQTYKSYFPELKFHSDVWATDGVHETLVSEDHLMSLQGIFAKLFINEYDAIAFHPKDGFIQYTPYIDVLENLMLAQYLSKNEILPIELMSIVADHISTDRAVDYKEYTYESLYNYIFSEKDEGYSFNVTSAALKNSHSMCEIYRSGVQAYLRHGREWKIYPVKDFGDNKEFYFSHGYSGYYVDDKRIFDDLRGFVEQKIPIDSIRVFGWINICFYLRESCLLACEDIYHW